ncbi:hypothetical protein ACH5RR_010738 [Cinchona calisaya]|uniref:NAB domain-containing protein n=1 Tax=Cinchona calisaya TaxID=153742 RepID=A0ABD3AJU4_9GENT
MMGLRKQETTSHWWWFDRLSNNTNTNQKRPPWLHSTLSELDEKTKAMLKVIEEDADSFAQRAEMYYKKRPELISMVEDFYRMHRLLAERYDQLKSESGTRLITPWASPLSFTKCRPEKLMSLTSSIDKSYDSFSETYESEELGESDIEDPEPEEEVEYHKEIERKEVLSSDGNNQVIMKLMEEIERLKEENSTQKEQLMQKDEEKRDVIRQLSLAMDLLREENVELRKRVVKDSPKKQKYSEMNKLEGFWKRLFNNFN